MMLRSPGRGEITIRSTTPARCFPNVTRRTMTMTARCCSLSSSDSEDSVSMSRKKHAPIKDGFTMSPIEFLFKNPPFIERTRNELADYCGRLEGDECYNCWDAYYDLRYLQNECPKEEVENLIIDSGGLKALVRNLRWRAALVKSLNKEEPATSKVAASEPSTKMDKPESTSEAASAGYDRHIPDGIPEPGSTDEKEDEDGFLDDSSYMKMLRVIARGHYPTHYGRADS
ncbi:CCG-binding protein 1-like protein [Drosera capensis]